MPGAGLAGLDAGVGHELGGGAQDAGDLAVADDAAVHLRQLAQAGGGELDVEGEAAGGDRLDDLVVAEHDEGAGAAAQDALEAVAQLGTRCDGGERGAQELVVVLLRRHVALRPAASPGRAVHGQCAHPIGSAALHAPVDRVGTLCAARSGRRAREACRGGRHRRPWPPRPPRCRRAPGPLPTTPAGTTARVNPSRCGLGEAPVGSGDRADLARQADLAERDGAVRQRSVGDGAGQRQA